MFKVGNTDYSNHVIAGAYAVEQKDVAVSWTDANHIEHRDVVRKKIEGSFDVYFKNMAEWDAFLNVLEANKTDGYYNITVVCNNLPSATAEKTINAFVEFAPKRNRNDFWADFMERFTISIEEC